MPITYQQESLVTFEKEAKELLLKHWEEIALNKDKIKFNPDWSRYYELEEAGLLKVFTARLDKKMIGYFIVVVNRSLHYKDHIFADNDAIFLQKEYRKGYTGSNLIKFVEKCLKDDGVSLLKINTKVHQPFDNLLSFLNFNLIERVYTKYLGD